MPDNYVYPALVLTGGGVTALDGFDGDILTDGDFALVQESGQIPKTYRLNATLGVAEDSPLYIVPDTNPGTKVWVMTSVLHKIDATQAPTVNNDINDGYSAGSTWTDITNDKAYICLDNTDGAAVWKLVTLPDTIANVLTDHNKAAHDALALSHDSLSDVSVDDHHAQLHEMEHRVGGTDVLNHDTLYGFVAAEHLDLPNTIALVLTDHNKAAHDALGLSHDSLVDVSIDDHHARDHAATHALGQADPVDHDALTNFVAAEHLSLPNTIANVLSDHSKAAHDALGLSHDSLSDVSIDDHHNRDHAGSHNAVGADPVDHDALTNFVAAEHLSLPNTIANVLSDHTKAAHDALGLSHDSLADVSSEDHHPSDKISEGNSDAEVVDAGTGYFIVRCDATEAFRVDPGKVRITAAGGYLEDNQAAPAGTRPLGYNGYLYATRVYNAVYN